MILPLSFIRGQFQFFLKHLFFLSRNFRVFCQNRVLHISLYFSPNTPLLFTIIDMTSPPWTRNKQREAQSEPPTGKKEKTTSGDTIDRRGRRRTPNIPNSILLSSSSDNNPILDASTSTDEDVDLKSCSEEDETSVCIVRPKSSSDDGTTKAPSSFKHLNRSQLAERLQAEIFSASCL